MVVISPNQLKESARSHGSAGNKDDRFDTFVLADFTLRTDRSNCAPCCRHPSRSRPAPDLPPRKEPHVA